MNLTLFNFICENAEADYNEPEKEPSLQSLEKKFNLEFPPDYANVLTHCSNLEFYGESNNLLICSRKDIMYLNTDSFYMLPLNGLYIMGKDGGGNFYLYDPTNKLTHGEYAMYWCSRSDMSLSSLRFIGHTLTEVVEKILDTNSKSFFNWPKLGNTAEVKENPRTPAVIVNSMDNLQDALPFKIMHPVHGRGYLKIEEKDGLISGGYILDNTDLLFYTFSSSYQGFYNAIAPELMAHGLL